MLQRLQRLFAAVLGRHGNRNALTQSSTSTEFTAEVVRIAAIEPHGNADKLEVARIEMKSSGLASYEVITQKGEYKPGDLAAYLSVDCLLPLDRKEFAFLKRPESNKTIHRLKAARLRGRFSQGLLVPAPKEFEFGASVATHFGVTYHSPEEDEPNAQVHGGTSKTKPQAFPIYGVTSLKKAPTTFTADEPVVITEKVHGSNFRFGWVRRKILGIPVGWRFVVGSHRVMKGIGTAGYYGEDLWLEAAKRFDLARKTKDYKGHIFYGELFGCTASGKKIQDLTYGRVAPTLVLFDIQYAGRWFDYDTFINACADIELDPAPLLYCGPFDATKVLELAEGKSTIKGAETQIREGCVVASPDGERKAKYVGAGYLLRDESKQANAPIKEKRDEKRREARA